MGSGLTWRGLRDRGVGGGGCAQNNEGVFGLQVSPLTPATTRPPELRLECCGTGLGGVGVVLSARGEALLRTKMAILGQVVLSRAPQGIMTGLRTPELYLEWDSDGR